MAEPFGEQLRRFRRRSGMTQEALAEAAGISPQAVGLLERNLRRYPRPSTVGQLASALGCSAKELESLLSAAQRAGGDRFPLGAVDFTGRTDELSKLAAMLTAEPGPAVPVVAVTGMGGIGKTALAVETARRLADRFPDGLLFIDLRGFSLSGPVDALDAVRQLLRTLGVGAVDLPTGLEEAAARYRTAMAGRSMLVVLDNAASGAQVAALIPGAGRNAVLLTSRHLLLGPPGSRGLQLEGLPETDAMELLAGTAGRRFEDDPGPAREIVELCGRLPLAIRLAGAQLAGRPSVAVKELAVRLRDEAARLAVLDGDLASADGGVRSSIAMSVADLLRRPGELDPAAVRLLPRLAQLAGPDVGSRIAGRLAGLTPDHADRLLDRLTDVNLLDAAAPGRYRLHDLVAAYFDEQATSDEQTATRLTVLDEYAAALWRLPELSRRPSSLRQVWADGEWSAAAQDFTDREDALDWLDSERGNILATVSRAVEGGAAERERAVRIGVAMNYYCIARKRWEEWRDVTEQVGPLAVDPAARGILLADLGLAHAELEDFGRASDALESAVAVLEGVDSPEYQVSTLVNLSHVLERAGRQETGLRYGRQGLELAERISDHEAQAMAALVVGMIYGARQDPRYEEYFAIAVSAMRAAGSPRGLAMVFHQIAVSHLEGGRFEAGERVVAESLRLYRDDDAVTYLPDVQETIGKLRLASGDPGSAVVQFNDALAGAIGLGQLDREASVRTKLAEALLLMGRSDDARPHLTKAVEIYRRLGTSAVERPLALLADLDAGSGGA